MAQLWTFFLSVPMTFSPVPTNWLTDLSSNDGNGCDAIDAIQAYKVKITAYFCLNDTHPNGMSNKEIEFDDGACDFTDRQIRERKKKIIPCNWYISHASGSLCLNRLLCDYYQHTKSSTPALHYVYYEWILGCVTIGTHSMEHFRAGHRLIFFRFSKRQRRIDAFSIG